MASILKEVFSNRNILAIGTTNMLYQVFNGLWELWWSLYLLEELKTPVLIVGMLAAKAAGVPKRIYHLRGMPLLTAKGAMRRVLWATESTSFSCAHSVLAVSHSLAEATRSLGIVGASKARVLANGSGNGVDALNRFDPQNTLQRAEARLREV